MLARRGNATAAALVLGVVSPSASGIGGGGFALVRTASDGRSVALDFRETAPARHRAESLFPTRKPGETAPDRFAWIGPRGVSVGVPGEPAGLELLVRRFDTGVLLDSQLDDFSAPEDVKPFGVEWDGPNRPRPRARPVSSVTPTVVLEGGKPVLAVGGSGPAHRHRGRVQLLAASDPRKSGFAAAR